MVAIGRALMAEPTLILMDEPSEGLSPKLVQKVEEILLRLRNEGHSVLLVEQNLALALAVADKIYVISSGSFVFEGTPAELSSNPEILNAHLGVSSPATH
jgi:branched-chain amino acid transport system ATP-binding protein